MSSTLSLKPLTLLHLLLPSTTHFSLLPPLSLSRPFSLYPRLHSSKPLSTLPLVCKSSSSSEAEKAETERFPEKNKPLYAHSLPCIESWLMQLGFRQRAEDPAAWVVEKGDWHAYLNLDVTDLSIRYLKTGPGNLEKDVERRFSYALSREDIENAILGGP